MADINKFINKVKSGVSVAANEATSLTRSAISKSSSMVDQTKLNFAVRELETKMNDAYTFIGKYVYEQAKKGAEFTGEVAEKCTLIKECEERIMELKREIAQAKNAVLCHRCGHYVPSSSTYCPECGEKL